jgi:hypothetical protein
METTYAATLDTKKMTPMDLAFYKLNRKVLTRLVSLQKLWNNAKSYFEKTTTRRLIIDFLNENFDSMEKSCGFLGVIHVNYTLMRIRKTIEESLNDILEKYNIPRIEKPKKTKEEDFLNAVCEKEYLTDDLDIYLNTRKNFIRP